MVANVRGSLGPALAVYVAFVALVAVANAVFGGPAAAAPAGRALVANGLLYVGAVTLAGIVAPLWLGARARLTLPMWPAPGTGDNAFAVLVVVFLFARVEMLVAIFAEGRPGGLALATFLGPAALHLASVIATIGVLLPALKGRMPVAPATVIAALAWALYYVAQFNVLDGGLDVKTLFALAVFGLGYSLFYFWSRSLLLTAILQHLVATTTLIYNRDVAFGETDARFFYSLGVLVVFIVFVTIKRRLYAAERFTYF